MVLLNIAVFIALHLTQVDALVKHKITRLLADKLDMDVQIGSFDFNDKQVNVSNITLRTADGKVSGIIRQIYIEYDLFPSCCIVSGISVPSQISIFTIPIFSFASPLSSPMVSLLPS